MFRDEFGNIFRLSDEPNPQIIITGRSGFGKSFATFQMLDDYIKLGKNTLVLDFAGSYTVAEAEKASFSFDETVRVVDMKEKGIDIPVMQLSEAQTGWITEFIMAVWEFPGSLQEVIADKVAKRLCESEKPSLELAVQFLEEVMEERMEQEDVTGVCRVENMLDKVSSLLTRGYLDFWGNQGFRSLVDDFKGVTIIQLSHMPITVSKILTQAILWALAKMAQNGQGIFDKIILDEAQQIDMKSEIFSWYMRQGRKFKIGLVLATQFLDARKPEQLKTIQQAANHLYFHPTDMEVRKVAQQIDATMVTQWQKILQNLKIGEAVLVGHYTVNGNRPVLTTPVVVQIVVSEEKKERKNNFRIIRKIVNVDRSVLEEY